MEMKHIVSAVLILISVTGASVADAQYRGGRYHSGFGNLTYAPGVIQITPFAGFLLGDEYDAVIERTGVSGRIQQDDCATLGLRLGFGLVPNVGIEFQYSQADTSFYGVSGSSFFDSRSKLSDVDIHMFLVNINFDFSNHDIVPYMAVGMGTSLFDVKEGRSESEFTGTMAGGVKARLAPNIALRFEVRGYITQVEDSEYSYYWDGYYSNWSSYNDPFLATWESTLGLSFIL